MIDFKSQFSNFQIQNFEINCLGCRIWEELRKGASPDLLASEQDELLAGMEAAFRALKRLQKAADAFQAAFPLESDIKTMDPAASSEAVAAAATAANIALVRMHA